MSTKKPISERFAAKSTELTPAQKAARTRAANKAEKDRLAKLDQQRLAQMVNLHIGGYSLDEIAHGLGMTVDEVTQSLERDTAKYIKSQPALRIYARNFISSKYMDLLEAIWDDATDKSPQKMSAAGFDKRLASQDRAIKILSELTKLHGAAAPVQTEVKVESSSEAVDALMHALTAKDGLDYDLDVFDIVDAEVVHDSAVVSGNELEAASRAVEDYDEDEDL